MLKLLSIHFMLPICLAFQAVVLSGQGNTPPEKPFLRYVTVDTATNNVRIFWEKSPSPKVASYVIYRKIKTPNPIDEGQPIDTVPAGTTSYTHLTSGQAGQESIFYSLSAIDSAGNPSNRTGLHATIHSSVKYDSCNATLKLSWNKYLGWGNNVSGYRVYLRKGSEPFKRVAGIKPGDSTLVVYEVPENTQYNFFIEGVKNDSLVSSSNICGKYTYMPLPPQEIVLDYVSVAGQRSVDMSFRFTSPTEISSFALLRSNQEYGQLNPVKVLSGISSSPIEISDSIFTSVNRFFYRIAALNTCGVVIDTSNLGSNILLTGSNNGGANVLEWNAYKDFPLGTYDYEIYRIDTSGNTQLITALSNQETYTDDLSLIYGQDYPGKVGYRVRAVENGSQNYAFSNICEIKVKSEIWMPNAFTPNADGKNDLFAPRLNFLPEDYLMLVYDRAGTVIFSSKSPEIGWDGRIGSNQPAPEGVYVYHIRFSSFNGQKYSKTGSVTVFYPR